MDALPVFTAPVDSAIQASLQESVGARLAGIPLIHARFQQRKKIQALRRPLLSSGSFLYARNHGVCWNFEKPFPSRYTITEASILQETGEGPPKITTASEQPRIKEFGALFSAVFTGRMEALDDQFQVRVAGDESRWTLGLVPKPLLMRKVISHIVIDGGETVERVRILETNGDLTDLTFDEVTTGGTLTDEEMQRFEQAD